MVNEYGAQYWRYEFVNNVPESYVGYEKMKLLPSVYIYDFSEERAREKFEMYFGIEAGKLLDREPW